MPSPSEITVPQLARLIGTPDCPVLIDLRIDDDYQADPGLIPTGFRHPYDDIESVVSHVGEKRVVVYCHRGKKISQGSAAVLRSCGIQTETLDGGHVAWRDASQPVVPVSALPQRDSVGRTVWVTRHRPKIDRVACPWLIRRFVDPAARFLFVAPSEVMAVAEKFDATPFDIEDVFWTHRDDRCTFDTMIEEFELSTEPLQRLGNIIRGADTNRHELSPQSAGLLAASLGLSRMYRDDLAQLDATMVLYDAMYRWCRDATDEGHGWPT